VTASATHVPHDRRSCGIIRIQILRSRYASETGHRTCGLPAMDFARDADGPFGSGVCGNIRDRRVRDFCFHRSSRRTLRATTGLSRHHHQDDFLSSRDTALNILLQIGYAMSG
jgi:hypothetical protein